MNYYYLLNQLPTPTPRPYSTPSLDMGLENMPRNMAVEAVQSFNSLNEAVLALQVVLVLIILFGGIYLLIRALRSI